MPDLLAGGLFMFFSYLGYLDYNVRKQFEGKRWAVPARVYAVRLSFMPAMP